MNSIIYKDIMDIVNEYKNEMEAYELKKKMLKDLRKTFHIYEREGIHRGEWRRMNKKSGKIVCSRLSRKRRRRGINGYYLDGEYELYIYELSDDWKVID